MARQSVTPDDPSGPSRRQVVRHGTKLVFVAPVLSTFFARQAHAQASGNQSCYPTGHVCNDGGPNNEPCCSGGACNLGVCP